MYWAIPKKDSSCVTSGGFGISVMALTFLSD